MAQVSVLSSEAYTIQHERILLSPDAYQNVNRATIARVTKSWTIKMLYTLKEKALDQHIISDALHSQSQCYSYLSDEDPPDVAIIPVEFCEHLNIIVARSTDA